METIALIVGVFMALFWMSFRMREAARPLTLRRIVMPPLGMSTGAFMYVVPMFRPSGIEAVEAMAAGLVCSAILIATTKLERRDDGVFLRPSRAFVFILVGLFAVRFAARTYLGHTIEFHQLSGMFFLLALVMIVGWRAAMLMSFRRLSAVRVQPAA